MSLVRSVARRLLPAGVRLALRSLLAPETPRAAEVSTGYEPIARADVARLAEELGRAWQDPGIPATQLALAESQLTAFGRGERIPVFDVFVSLLGRIPGVQGKTLLEVGCSSGYYADVLRLRGMATEYAGCDYSPAFVALARERLPGVAFDVRDATRLEYADASKDIVVSGCCILHIADYPAAIREAARVAREYVLFHRTPVLHTTPTTHYRKLAYGVPCMEIHFNETELLHLFREAGLRLVEVETVGVGGHAPAGDAQLSKSYLCEKI